MENFNFKKFFKPRREFEEKTKNLYLSAYDEKFPPKARLATKGGGAGFKPARVFHFNYALRGAGVFAALLLLVTGTSVYAYGKNVGPTNVLYPLKRAQEDVRAYLAPAEKKSAFHLGLAEKRLAEAEILKTKNADSPRAVELINDMKLEVKKSFETLPPPQEALPSPSTPSQPVEEKPQSSGATQPKRNDADVLPTEPVKQPEIKSGTIKPTPSSKINPPIFGPPKDTITEKETIKQNPIRENVVFPTSSKIAPQTKSEGKINPSAGGQFSSVQSKSQSQICKFVNGLIANRTNGIKKEIINDPEISSKFRENCEPQMTE